MIKNSFYYVLIILCSIIVFGCDKKDGDWAPIQVTVNGNRCKSSTFSVPANGGVFLINSKNYGKLWLNTIKEDGKIVYDNKFSSASLMYTHVTTEWYEVQYNKDENIVVDIQPNNGESTRSITLQLQHGDAFGTVTLLQDH